MELQSTTTTTKGQLISKQNCRAEHSGYYLIQFDLDIGM